MSEVVKTIKSSGGDYSSLASWEAALVSLVDDQTGSVEEAFDAGAVTIDVVNALNVKIKATAAAAYRFNQHASWRTNNKTAGAGSARIAGGVTVGTSNVIIEWLYVVPSAGNGAFIPGGNNPLVRQCVVNSEAISYCIYNGKITAVRCFFFWGLKFQMFADGGSSIVVHCNLKWTDDIVFSGGGAAVVPINSISQSFSGSATGGAVNGNVGVGVTAPGTTHWDNETGVFAATNDLHFDSSKVTSYAVSDVSGTYPDVATDIDGAAVSGQYYAGADQGPVTYTAAVASATGGAAGAVVATFVPPSFTASVASATGGAAAAMSATFVPPTSTGATTTTTGGAASGAAGTTSVPVFSANISSATGGAASAADATFVPPTFTGATTTTTGGAASAADATFVPPTFTGATTTTTGGAASEASGTTTVPVFSAVVTSMTSGADTAGAGHTGAPIFTADVATVPGGAASEASGTHVPPTFSGDSAVEAGGAAASAAVVNTPPMFSSEVASQTGGTDSASSGTTVVPTFSGAGASQVGGAAAASSGTFVPPLFSAVVACQTGGIAGAASGTFGKPVYAATVTATAGGAAASATATATEGIGSLHTIACARMFQARGRRLIARAWLEDSGGNLYEGTTFWPLRCTAKLLGENSVVREVVGEPDPAGEHFVRFDLPNIQPNPSHAYVLRIAMAKWSGASLGERDFTMGTS